MSIETKKTINDYIVRASAFDNTVRVLVALSTNTANEAYKIHDTTPVASAALGRTITAAALMGLLHKNAEDLVTLSFKGDGPLGGILATADGNGHVKGYVHNPQAEVPLKQNGKLDVSGAIGEGMLTVIKDIGLKEPYSGRSEIVSGEIAEDLAFYYYLSEQTPSCIALGVLVDVDYSIKKAGGFIFQMMPGVTEETTVYLENKIKELPPITTMLEMNMTPEDICYEIFGRENVEISGVVDLNYSCNCSRERVEKAFIGVGIKDLTQILEEDGQAELSCHFCDKTYSFSKEDIEQLIKNLEA